MRLDASYTMLFLLETWCTLKNTFIVILMHILYFFPILCPESPAQHKVTVYIQ